MEDVESLAHTMYWLEISINQGKVRDDWEELPEDTKNEWRQSAGAVLRFTK